MEINRTTDDAPQIQNELIGWLQAPESDRLIGEAKVYTSFPIFTEYSTGPVFADVCIVSETMGIVAIFCSDISERGLEASQIDLLRQRVDQFNSCLFASLIKVPSLRKSRNSLYADIHLWMFTPRCHVSFGFEDEYEITRIFDRAQFVSAFQSTAPSELSDAQFVELVSSIEGSRVITKSPTRSLKVEGASSKGAILNDLESQMAVFDSRQKIAALSVLSGPQRIRGLAGSGKTVILALKAAIYHIRFPDKMVLYTFWTKNLYQHVRDLIARFYRSMQSEEPNWDRIHIRHGWGGRGAPGVYYDACRNNQLVPMPFDVAKAQAKNESPFNFACRDLLRKNGQTLKKTYDLVLLDEGQDFDPPFYWLCRRIVRNDCIVWAYDDLQTVLDVEIQDAEKLFQNEFGDQGINLKERQNKLLFLNNDIVLERAYRNPREILMVATAIGFGLYSNHVVQMLENREHWSDLGFEVVEGSMVVGSDTIIGRPAENSPSLVSSHQMPAEIVFITSFDMFRDEVDWVASCIAQDIEDDLLPHDILVISLDDRNARGYFEAIQNRLNTHDVQSNIVSADASIDKFFEKGSVTMTTVYRAKGNEAAMVYIVGTDALALQKETIRARNKVFTALTRAKAWVRMSGINPGANWLKEEVARALADFPVLKFTYPDPAQLRMLRRSLTERAEKKSRDLQLLLESIGNSSLEGEEIIQALKALTKKEE